MLETASDPLQSLYTIAVIILAGGHSRRMGQDKALLMLPSGQSLLAHTYDVASQLTPEVVVVTPWPARYDHHLPPLVRWVQEPAPSQLNSTGPHPTTAHATRAKPSNGPLYGFAYGWQHIAADWCLLLACDLPYLDADVLRQWWHWLIAHEADEPIMASLVPGPSGWEPLCGFYHRRCLPSLQRQISQQQRSFQPWLRKLAIAPYTAVPSQMLFNCNTLTDWQRLTSHDV